MVDAPQTISQSNIASRLRVLLPAGWFPSAPPTGEAERAPILNALLQGCASVFAWVWSWFVYIYPQQRLNTATGAMLEIYAQDFFGDNLPRESGESDDSYRARIKDAIVPLRFTRPAIEAALQSSWPDKWRLVEPWNASDTMGLASLADPSVGGGYGYGTANSNPSISGKTILYGTRMNPFQGFVFLDNTPGLTTPDSVNTAINETRAGGVVFWMQPLIALPDPEDDFGNDIV